MKKEGRPQRHKFSIIRWRSVEERPEDARSVLLQCVNEFGDVYCEYAAYEDGHFLYIYSQYRWAEVNETCILGWSYLPFEN